MDTLSSLDETISLLVKLRLLLFASSAIERGFDRNLRIIGALVRLKLLESLALPVYGAEA